MAERLLNLYTSFRLTGGYFDLDTNERREFRHRVVESLSALASATHFYSVFPTRSEADFLVWSALPADDPAAPGKFFKDYARAVEELEAIDHEKTLWGMTRPSMYSRGKSEQDMDPLEGPRSPYLIVYPFSKTKDWYLMSMDARQGQMNEHIKIGKQFFDIKQLLLYSFGLQDQEFVVSYETEDLGRFSELVQALRSTEGRRHTLLDTPIVTGVYQTHEEFVR
jgi:chlorite dismutase